MKKHMLLIAVALITSLMPVAGFSGRGDEEECEEEDELNPEDRELCAGYKTLKDGCDVVYSCTSCDTGYTLIPSTAAGMDYNYCEETCNTNTNCVSDSVWVNGAAGYQHKINRSCDSRNNCNENTVYRCAAGYYGTSSNGTSGCARCPAVDGMYGASAAGATSITLCYISSGTSGRDSTGLFTYSGNSYYCN